MEPIAPHSFENAGAHESPPDARDFTPERIRVLASAAPPVHQQANQNGPLQLPIFYQAQTPACIPHSLTWAYCYKQYLKNKAWPATALSPRFLYALCKANDGVPNVGGTYPRTGYKMLQTYGIAPDSDFPNTVTLPLAQYQATTGITSTAYADAKPISGDTYTGPIALDADSLKAAIDEYSAITMCLQIGNEWWTAANGATSWEEKDVLPVRPPKSVVSGHQIAIYGYDETQFYFANSFGSAWGDNGYGWLDIAAYQPYFKEAWGITELTPDVVATLKQAAQQLQTEQQTAPTQQSEAWINALLAWLENLAS